MEKNKTVMDYLNTNDTEQMFFALYPLMRRGELTPEEAAILLGGNRNKWDVMEMFWKNNLSTLVDKERNVLEEVAETKKFVVGYNEK